MTLDRTPRYAPTEVMTVQNGMMPVIQYIAHPAGNHPVNCPIKDDMVALELKTAESSRWYGCERAYINSELRMVVIGTDPRDEVRMGWKVAERELPKPHYIAGSGERGCLYDSCHVYRSLQGAVDGLAETFGLGRTRKAQLKRRRSLELRPGRDGAEYCEITECRCATPWVHDETADEDDWQE